MVFSSHPLYQLDPPNYWQNQQQQQQHQQLILYGGGNENSSSNTDPRHPPLQEQPRPAATGGPRNIRPGSMTDRARMAKVPLPETALKCPRCESTNTKFCYFNNYSLYQPRHFCKTCRRYWTRGGSLRNVPVGGGCRRPAKRSGKKRCKSPTVSGTATVTTTTNSTDQAPGDHINGNNMIDGVQFPFYPQGSMNQMGRDFGDHYTIGGVNDFGGAQTDPHIAGLFQTGVMSLADITADQQWSRLDETTLTKIHSRPFPFLTNLAQQEPSSQPSGLLYQFDQCGGRLGLSGSGLDSLGNGMASGHTMNMSMNPTVTTQFTNVKMEDREKGLRRSLGMSAQAAASYISMANNVDSQFSMVGSRIGNTWTDYHGFSSYAPTTGHDG